MHFKPELVERLIRLKPREVPKDTSAVGEQFSVAIEKVPLGSRIATQNPNRIATQNPNRNDIDDSLPEPDPTWKLVHMEFRHKNGSLIETELLRPVEWIEIHNLRPGARVSLSHSEIDTRGTQRR